MKIFIYSILITLFCGYAVAETGPHNDKKHGHDMSAMKMEVSDSGKYIRHMSPAGNNIVIGRKNTLYEITPKIISEDGIAIKVFHLTVEDVKFEMSPGINISGWGFNGLIPGPTIRVREGDRIRIILKNNTDTEHTLHVHGQSKPVAMDGVPYLSQNPLKGTGILKHIRLNVK